VVLAVGGARGQPYRVSPWEFSFRAYHASAHGRHDEAVALMAEGLAAYPDHPRVLYHAACCESLADRRAQALEHLRRALALEPELARDAAGNADLDPIRDDPAFPRTP
jgi:tetratricopeptide (TPR) repeat protein